MSAFWTSIWVSNAMQAPHTTSCVRTAWNGIYFDGRTPRRNPVTITIMAEGLRILKEDGATIWWPYHELSRATSYQLDEPVVLQRHRGTPEGVLVDEKGFIGALMAVAPSTRQLLSTSIQQSVSRVPVILLTLLALISIVVFLYVWTVPTLAAVAAARFPLEWEERLGQAAVDQLVPARTRCDDHVRMEKLNRIIARLRESAMPSPYSIHLTVADYPVANAFAVPGGQVVVLRGLLEKTQSAEELAGVLAHEIQHIHHRHALTGVLRRLSFHVLVLLAVGNTSGLSSALEAAAYVGNLRYERKDEEVADEDGMRLLIDARIDPHGLPRALERLQESNINIPEGLEYLSTHPLAQERIARLERMAEEASIEPIPLLPDYEWKEMAGICGEAEPQD
jgi:Zn-dependent protease with chaperone function